MSNKFLTTLALCALYITINTTTAKEIQITHENNAIHTQNALHLLELLKGQFNKPEYCKEILPNNFSHLIELLEHGVQTGKPVAYAHTVLNPFTNMLKGAEYVSCDAFDVLLHKLPNLLNNYCIPRTAQMYLTENNLLDIALYDRFKLQVNDVLYKQFSTNYEYFKTEPEAFLDEIATKVRDLAHDELEIEKFRHAVIRFLDTCLSKVIWDPKQPQDTWQSMNKMCYTLAELLEKNIINDPNDLDNLYWTLVHRFLYYVDLMKLHLPITFFESVKSDILNNDHLLFQLDEQDSWIQDKKSYMLDQLFKAEVKNRAYDQGVITA